MAKSSGIQFYSPEEYSRLKQDHSSLTEQLGTEISAIQNQYIDDIEALNRSFSVNEHSFLEKYVGQEDIFRSALKKIDEETSSSFLALDEDYLRQQSEHKQSLIVETDRFDTVNAAFEELKKSAAETFVRLCEESDKTIEQEVRIHREFVASRLADFNNLKEHYAKINAKQYDSLLWSIEKSKNALANLKAKLTNQADSDQELLDGNAKALLSELKRIRTEITDVFKSATSTYFKHRDEIQDIGKERQKPHSVVNEEIISQYVDSINVIATKQNTFAARVTEDIQQALSAIGERMIQSDLAHDYVQTRKYVMQYEIVSLKGKYLLKNNQEMNDLLINKYQTEIRKLKIDSFRRVEEIKLAYYMPYAFCQNNINIYSNFAFTVNESLDEIETMLGESIRFNEEFVCLRTDYLHDSAKVFEDYKLKVSVLTNNIENHLADLLAEIDRVSMEIIVNESKNRLEIAEIKKEMDHSDITADYRKYLAKLESDFSLADFQYRLNLQNLEDKSQYRIQLISNEKETVDLWKNELAKQAETKHAILLNALERDIRDQNYEKEKQLSERRLDFERSEITLKSRVEELNYTESLVKRQYFFSRAYQLQHARYTILKERGNAFVVDFVHRMQSLIDLNNHHAQASKMAAESKDRQTYLRHLYAERNRFSAHFDRILTEKNSVHDDSVRSIHHEVAQLKSQFDRSVAQTIIVWKKTLIGVDHGDPSEFAALLLETRFGLTSLVKSYEDHHHLVTAFLMNNESEADVAAFNKHYNRTLVILTTSLEEAYVRLLNAKSRPKLLKKLITKAEILSLEAHEQYRQDWTGLIDQVANRIITPDVLIAEANRKSLAELRRIVESKMDESLAFASRRYLRSRRLKHRIEIDRLAVETEIKHRVNIVNHSYLSELKALEQELAFVKTQLEIEMRQESQLIDETKLEIRQLTAEQIANAEKRHDSVVAACQTLKLTNAQQTEESDRLLNQDLLKNQESAKSVRLTLETKLAAAPKQMELELSSRSLAKNDFIVASETALLHRYHEIEEEKYVARPQFIRRMDVVKDRLPEDYRRLYTEISHAEADFLRQLAQNSTVYSDEYAHFLASQVEYTFRLEENSALYRPYDDFAKLTESIAKKTDEVYEDTLQKSERTRSSIKKHAQTSDENQKRILNV